MVSRNAFVLFNTFYVLHTHFFTHLPFAGELIFGPLNEAWKNYISYVGAKTAHGKFVNK